MGLEQDIVITNEYTTKNSSGGTRGKTPKNYVLQYMIREGRVNEVVFPVDREPEPSARYVKRLEAASKPSQGITPYRDMVSQFKKIDGRGGIAFGNDSYSLSDDAIKDFADDIQESFDNGKTVLKTVVSFTDDYLAKNKLLSDDFKFNHAGDYRGNVDQLRLRLAVMKSVDLLAEHYDDLRYVGVIHVNTDHVHCHLAMFENGSGVIMSDGFQRGRLTSKMMFDMRRGIDSYLERTKHVTMVVSNPQIDKQNVLCHAKLRTYESIRQRGLPQFITACLPQDRSLWMARSSASVMTKANNLMRDYTNMIFSNPMSGYGDAKERLISSASSRYAEEHNADVYNNIVRSGEERLVLDGMDAVYSVLRSVDRREFSVKSPFMDMMSRSLDEIRRNLSAGAEKDDFMEFGYRLRSYKNRADYHKNERSKYHDAILAYDRQQDVSSDSRVLREFMLIEEQYNAMLVAKYQYLMPFDQYDFGWDDELKDILIWRERAKMLQQMYDDESLRVMSADDSEKTGLALYNEPGGHYLVSNPDIIRDRAVNARHRYTDNLSRFMMDLNANGYMLDKNNNIVKGSEYAFEDVRSLDLHKMRYDFRDSFHITDDALYRFVDMAKSRMNSWQAAKDYLVRSGQQQTVVSFPESDIVSQSSFAGSIERDGMFRSGREEILRTRRTADIVRIDNGFCNSYEPDIVDATRSVMEAEIF